MQKGTVGAAKIGASLALLAAVAIFSVYIIMPALAVLDNTVNTIVLRSPANNTYISNLNGNITLNASLTGTNVSDNTTFYYLNSTSVTLIGKNQTVGPDNFTFSFNTTFLKDGVYSFFVNATNLTGAVVNATNGNITIDNTAPVLNFPTPTNNSYVYGTTTQLFQTNVTETNLNAAKNVTLNYKVNTTSTWTQSTLVCYNSTGLPNANSGPFKCNVTVDMTPLYIENDRIQYYFNTTDFAGNTGNNGTSSDPLFIILDQTKPTPSVSTTNDSDSIIGKGTGINLSVRWTDNYALFNATLSTNETGSWINWTTAYGSPYTLSGAADWSNFTWANNSIVGGTVVAWKVYANDQVQPTRNENVSIQGTFTIDGVAPRYTENTNATNFTSGTKYEANGGYGFQINWTDTDISIVSFQLGRPTGTLTNYTSASTPAVTASGNNYYINFSQNQLGKVGTYNITWFANDTSANQNGTQTVVFSITQAATLTSLWLNGTAGNRLYSVGAPYNFTSALNVSGKTMKIDSNNITGWVIQSYTNSNVTNESTVPMTPAVYNITGYFEATENYTASSQTYYAIVSGWMNTTVSVNDSYVKAGDGLNIGCLLRDANASTTLGGYYVEIYNGTTNLSAGRTDASGLFNYTLAPAAVDGAVTAKCAVYNNYTSLYNTSANGTTVYTMDSTAPVLSSPIPVNNTYITGTSAQLFQINATETNIDSSKNITLNYRRNGVSIWTQSTLVCYNSTGLPNANSGPFKCNVTADLTVIGDNQIVQYYFNTTDLSGNAGNHGTITNWLNATIDRANPRYLANASSPATYANYSASGNYGFQINWTNSASGIQTVIFQFGRTSGTMTNYTSATTPAVANTTSTYYVNFTQAALGPAGIYNITWFANDTAGNANTTGTYNYQIYNASNIVNVYLNDSTGQTANGNLATTYGNTTIITATASAGTVYIYRNVTLKFINGTTPQNETGIFGAGFIVYKVNATGNENYTDNTSVIQYNITTAKSGPSSYLNLQINGTDADSSRAYPNVTNVTGWFNATSQSNIGFVLFRNDANMTINNTVANYNRTETILLGVGNYTYIYNTTGNANFTSGSISRSLNITKGTPSLGLFINSTASNQTYGYPTVARITGNNSDVGNSTMAYELFRNSTNITATVANNDANLTLAGAVYLLIYNVTSNANYTSASTTLYLTISKAATNVSLWLNGTQGSLNTYNRYDIANLTAKLNVSGKNVSIYVNGTLLNTSYDSSSRLENTTNLTNYAAYNITAHFAGDENYTTSLQQYNATTIDTTGPTIRVYNATAQQFLNLTMKKSGDTLILNISASDSGIGITTGSLCVVTVGGSAAGIISYSSGWCNGTITVPSLATGYRVINITLNDTNNNTGFNDTFALSIDNTAPVLNLTAPSNLSYVKVNADGFMWINGTVYDLLGVGVTNITVGGANASLFAVWTFNGTNNSAFTIRNNTYVPDGLVNLTLYYNDSMNNTGSMLVYIYEDNTGPSSVVGLTNSTAGKYQPISSQVVRVSLTDALQTNASITLNYTTNYRVNSVLTWLTTTMTGTPGTTTVYSAVIDTSSLKDNDYVLYYIAGVDNATNSISAAVGGSTSSPLGNITINQDCGYNGTMPSKCISLNREIFATLELGGGAQVNTWSSLGGNMTTPKVLESVQGSYNYVYYNNGTNWISYDTSVPWSQSDLKYMNNTAGSGIYYVNMTSPAVLRIV